MDPQVWLLHVRLARSRSPEVLDRLVEEYDRYARSLASRMHRDGESMDDLVQVAREALVRALLRFDPERSIPFPAFATPTILGSLRRHYRDRGWALRVPRRVHEIVQRSRSSEERLAVTLGRRPSVAEVAADIDVSVDELLEADDAAEHRRTTSIDATSAAPTVTAPRAEGAYDRVDDHLALQRAMVDLDDADAEIVGLYYFEGLSQREVGRRLGVSQMQVSRRLRSILRRLRVRIGEP